MSLSPAEVSYKVDRVAALRAEIKALETRERELTAALVKHLQMQGGRIAEGQHAIAILDYRHTPVVSAAAFYQALGDKAFAALSVRIEDARRLMGSDELAELTEETRTTAFLSVRAR